MHFCSIGKRWRSAIGRLGIWVAALGLAPVAMADALPKAVELAPGVFALMGAIGAPDAGNAGRVGNQGIIIGPRGAVVIGTGTSEPDGAALIELVKRLTDKPVVLAINTHGAPDHVLGNGAFARRGIPIMAHRETDRFLVANCDRCIANLEAALGATALGDTKIVRPDRLIDASTTIEAAGRPLLALHYGWTQQPGTIAIFDPASGVLFAGGLVSLDRIPELQAADAQAWMRALDQLSQLPPRMVVPGYGPLAEPARLKELAGYLATLHREIEAAHAAGLTIMEAVARVDAPGWRGWAMFEPYHRRNVHFEYLRAEEREFDAAAGERK